MRTLTIIATTCVIAPIVHAGVLHPRLLDPQIDSCQDGHSIASYFQCGLHVWYSSGGYTLTEIEPTAPPDPMFGVTLQAWGIHCDSGGLSTLNGKVLPFSACRFKKNDPVHAPLLVNCTLRSTDSWELTPDSTCTAVTGAWGAHDGAGPGGECVLIAQDGMMNDNSSSLLTPYGYINADLAANSGDRFCVKPLPPNTPCSLDLPPVIEHGVIGDNEENTSSVTGAVQCGAKWHVSVLGPDTIDMGGGVSTKISAAASGTAQVSVTSKLTSVNATPGAYSASTVIIVYPD